MTRTVWSLARALMAALILAAVVGQLVVSIRFWQGDPASDIPFLTVGFFSFFTIESNILAAVMLGALAWWGLADATPPSWFSIYRVCVVTYMVVTGVVYNLLLRGVDLPQGSTLGWSNEILHVIACVFVLVDWVWGPNRVVIRWRALWTVAIFPLAWVVYTLVRGLVAVDSRTGQPWYPYPFLNPHTLPGGYLAVAGYVFGIAAAIVLVGVGVIALSRRGSPASQGAEV